MAWAKGSTQQEFEAPASVVLTAAIAAVKRLGFKVKSVNRKLGRIVVRTKVSAFSYGEAVTIQVQGVDDNASVVAIESRLHVGVNVLAGGRHEKNFQKILEAIDWELDHGIAGDNKAHSGGDGDLDLPEGSTITSPSQGETKPLGPMLLAGVFSAKRPIFLVRISIQDLDSRKWWSHDSTWTGSQDFFNARVSSPGATRSRWSFEWTPPAPGRFAVRAETGSTYPVRVTSTFEVSSEPRKTTQKKTTQKKTTQKKTTQKKTTQKKTTQKKTTQKKKTTRSPRRAKSKTAAEVARQRTTSRSRKSSRRGSSTADELAKLADLKERGALSEEEFVQLKTKLLEN